MVEDCRGSWNFFRDYYHYFSYRRLLIYFNGARIPVLKHDGDVSSGRMSRVYRMLLYGTIRSPKNKRSFHFACFFSDLRVPLSTRERSHPIVRVTFSFDGALCLIRREKPRQSHRHPLLEHGDGTSIGNKD